VNPPDLFLLAQCSSEEVLAKRRGWLSDRQLNLR